MLNRCRSAKNQFVEQFIRFQQTKSVRSLHMDDNAVGRRGARYLALALKDNRNITELVSTPPLVKE